MEFILIKFSLAKHYIQRINKFLNSQERRSLRFLKKLKFNEWSVRLK